MNLEVNLANGDKIRIFKFEKIIVKNSEGKTTTEIKNSEIENFYPFSQARYIFVGNNILSVAGEDISYIILSQN